MTFCWLILMDDMSGWEPGPWQDQEQPPCQAVMDLLGLCGEAYLPFFKANADALQAGDEEVAVDIWGTTYRQRPFKFQGKCYRILRERFAGLGDDARNRILLIIYKTNCLQYII